ncbi:MAG TPA: NAD(P)H-dependent oxidoreductase [Fimbriimonadaceae bacterium]|nr:NAD(P)H-dependent oxidoreductase [Fimbriimonadaceae bacterium]
MANIHVLAIAGSLRQASYNRLLIKASQRLAPSGMTIESFDLNEIPPYNMDLEPNFPPAVIELKAKIKAADGLLIATPEHNFGVPGVLKNAIDWASRMPDEGVLDNKPVIVQSASPGWVGGLRAQMHLRPVLEYFPMRQMFFPEVVVGGCRSKFNDAGELTDELAIGNITKQLAAFATFIQGESA